MRARIVDDLNTYDKYFAEKLKGLAFDVLSKDDNEGSVVIDACGGLKLDKGEFILVGNEVD